MVWISGLVCLLTVVNLALKGLGAPFFIQLSRRLSTDWMYAWSRNPMENLKNSGIPLACQRNDSWSLADMFEIYLGKKPKTAGVIDRGEHGQLVNALKAEDLKRRIDEAKSLLKANGINTGN